VYQNIKTELMLKRINMDHTIKTNKFKCIRLNQSLIDSVVIGAELGRKDHRSIPTTAISD
jgi:hypothetical protein